MDIAAMSMQQSLRSLQSAISMSTLRKAMSQDAQAMSTLISDMQTANAHVSAPSADGTGVILDVRA